MALNTLYGRYGAQKPPLGSQIDMSHPLARGLSSVILLNENAGIAFNVVKKSIGTFEGGAGWASTRFGSGVSLPTATDAVNFGDSGIPNGKSDFSVFFRGQALADSTFREAGSSNGTGQDSLHWGTDSGNKWDFTLATVIDIVTVAAAVANSFYDVGMSYTRLSKVDFSIFNLTTPSVVTETVSNASTPVTASTTASRLGNIRAGGGNFGWGAPLIFTYVWNRVLSNAEMLWLHNEPYAFLLPPTYRRWFVPAAGAADVPLMWLYSP